MKKLISVLLLLSLLAACFTGCDFGIGTGTVAQESGTGNGTPADSATQPAAADDSTAAPVETEKTEIPENLTENVNTLSISCSEGTANCWKLEGKTLTFSGLDANTVVSVSGEFDGRIVIDAGDSYKFEIELCGVTLFCTTAEPIEIKSGDTITITAKKDSKNYIYDLRNAVDSSDDTVHSSAIYATCDLNLSGKGELFVISSNNNGIHTKDDLKVKNLTLSVTCKDNALKGNDSVTITGGVLTLIAKAGDGIKTSNSDISSKGNQRGTVAISGGIVDIYAACDGIDAAYNAEISDEAIVNIYTDKYSPYSESVETSDNENGNSRFIRFSSKNYNYSVKYYNSDTDFKWVNAEFYKSVTGGRSTYYYYSFKKLTGYSSVQIYIYSSGQAQGQDANYVVCTDNINWNGSYDTFALESRGGSLSYNWTNYTTSVQGGPGGFGGGPGGMADGNKDKGDYSTKGIKADNEIIISGGTITVKSYDDAIHANNDTTLENNAKPTGNVTISGGTLTLYSNDDGVHADGIVTISGGTLSVTGSYEGIEGNTILVKGGSISVVSSDDGMNATATSGTGMTFEGGSVYVYAGGDGLDANSKTSYKGIIFAGGDIVVVSTSGGNSSIDTEQGYTYSGGTVLALCPSNGMGSESTKCQNFTSIGKKTTMSLTQGQVLNVKVNGSITTSVTMPCKLSALVIYLGSSSATFETAK